MKIKTWKPTYSNCLAASMPVAAILPAASIAGTMVALPGVGELDEIAWDINDDGVVAGTAYDNSSGEALPVRWIDGEIEVLDGPLQLENGVHCLFRYGDARSITRDGTVLASMFTFCDEPTFRAVAWDDDTDTWTPLPLPAGSEGSWAPVANADGDIAYQVFGPAGTYHVLYDSDLGDITEIPGTNFCVVWAINNAGLATGQCGGQAMAWFAGDSIILGGGVSWSYGRGLNDHGTIVGVSEVGQIPDDKFNFVARAVLWDPLDPSRPKVLRIGWASDINNSGVIVGRSSFNSGPADKMRDEAIMWAGNRPRYLGTLGGPESAARAINDNGVIVGESDTTKVIDTIVDGNQTIVIYERDAFIYAP